MAQMVDKLDVAAARERFTSLQQGFTFFDAPGGSQVPDEVGDAIARALREASANIGAVYETSRRVGRILEQAEAGAARFLGCEPHEVIFGPNMTSLNFTLSRTAGREFAAGDEILVSSLDHDGGRGAVARARLRPRPVVRHIELLDDTTLDYDDLASKLGPTDPGGGVRVGVERGRDGRRRPAGVPARPRRRRAGVGRRRPLRRARADRRPPDRRRRADLLAVQVLRPAPRDGVRPRRRDRAVAAVQGAAGAEHAARPAVRDRHAAVRAARGLQRHDRLPRLRSAGSS